MLLLLRLLKCSSEDRTSFCLCKEIIFFFDFFLSFFEKSPFHQSWDSTLDILNTVKSTVLETYFLKCSVPVRICFSCLGSLCPACGLLYALMWFWISIYAECSQIFFCILPYLLFYSSVTSCLTSFPASILTWLKKKFTLSFFTVPPHC